MTRREIMHDYQGSQVSLGHSTSQDFRHSTTNAERGRDQCCCSRAARDLRPPCVLPRQTGQELAADAHERLGTEKISPDRRIYEPALRCPSAPRPRRLCVSCGSAARAALGGIEDCKIAVDPEQSGRLMLERRINSGRKSGRGEKEHPKYRAA